MRRSHDPRRLLAASSSPGIAAISHHSAAYLHGLIDVEPRLIHAVTVRGAHPSPPRDVIAHHTRALDPSDVTTIALAPIAGRAKPIGATGSVGRTSAAAPVTTPAMTVVMVAAYLDRDELATVVARALECGCTVSALQTGAIRRRRRGRCGPQRVLDALDQHTDARAATPA